MVYIYEMLRAIAFSKLDPSKIKVAVNEAMEQVKPIYAISMGSVHFVEMWHTIYVARHMADPELYYESLIPRVLPYQDYSDILDDIDNDFWTLVEKICQT